MNRETPTERIITERIALRANTRSSQPTFRLTATVGPDASKQIVVDGASPSRLLVGTGSTCHWRLADPAVSRRHLALSLRDGLLCVEDLDSMNGTFVGSVRMKEVLLGGGEDVFIGSTCLRVERLTEIAQVDVSRAASFGRVLGASIAMRKLYPTLAALAESDVPVLIEGEAGTGKELVAEALYERGPRCEGSLIVFDARTVPAESIDALLFGTAAAPGAIEQCRDATLVLDEPSELPATVQTKLASWLEKRAVARADGSKLEPFSVRMISLSRSDIEREIYAGGLREDLATLLSGARVELPPLRDRTGDVTLLATSFFRALRLDEDRIMSPLTLRRFEAYSWPGNVRELKEAVTRYASTGDDNTDPRRAFRGNGEESSPNELYERVLNADLPLTQAREIVVEDFDRRFVRCVLERHGGNVTRAAAASGLARRYFQILRNKRNV